MFPGGEMNPLRSLWDGFGQAVWLDYIERDLITGGGLQRLVAADGVRGVTSNPSIFHQAITRGEAYGAAIDALLAERPRLSTSELYEALAIEDIRGAADVLRPVYEQSEGGDGFVSLEVSPRLAADTAGTVDEARRLWREVARPNLMIKVPATAAGLPAVEQLIADGINVNVTLMFSLGHYEAVAAAYLRGLARAAEPARVASVASFFVSRVDTAVDAQLEALGTAEAVALRGRAAVAKAGLAYRRFREIFHGDAFASLRRRGARVQRPLWASTSTKNPSYPDVKYVDELVAPETVNTIPTATLDAYRDHGRPRNALAEAADASVAALDRIRRLGVDLDRVTERLQVEGVAAFARSFDQLMAALEAARLLRAGS
jgi:transaldolase